MLSAFTASAPAFAGRCKLAKIVEFPITMVGMRPLMPANINDVDVHFVVDSGASFSMISAASAARLKLKTSPAPYGFWLTGVHGAVDVSLATALNSRCWIRALEGMDLPLALDDCNAARKRAGRSSPFYAQLADSRGLAFLRMGAYDKSIADYDASLKINAKNVWSLYGRRIDRLRKHETSAGEADIARATAVWPQVAEEFSRRGIVP